MKKSRLFVTACVYVFTLFASNINAASIEIIGNEGSVGNCIPFGCPNSYLPSMGFVYQNIPAFNIVAGSTTVAFDTAYNQNISDLSFDIYMGATTVNGGTVLDSNGFILVAENQTPSDPYGNIILGDFELVYSTTNSFAFTGGGLVIAFVPTVLSPNDFTQNLFHSDSSDTSGLFVGRFFSLNIPVAGDDLTDPSLKVGIDAGFDTNWIGNVIIDFGELNPEPECGVLPSGIDTCMLNDGDILLGLRESWTDWGDDGARILSGTYFQHAALYVGNGKVSEATGQRENPDDDVMTSDLMDPNSNWYKNDLVDYAIIRPNASTNSIESAIAYARGKADQGNKSIFPDDTRDRILYNNFPLEAFDAFPDKYDEDKFYCSQLVWRSYFNQGIDLETDPIEIIPIAFVNLWTFNFVSPDDLFFSVIDNLIHAEQATLVAEKRTDLGNDLNRLVFRVFSPVDLLLIDPQGRRTGYDAANDTILNEIPGTTYTGPDEEPEGITYTGTETDFSLRVTGNDFGSYTLQTMSLNEIAPAESSVTKMTEPDASETFNIQADDLDKELLVLTVEIDVKPDSYPNTINLESSGVIPVAILSTPVFDATTLNPESLLLSESAVKANKHSEKYLCHENDVNNDGLNDLVCKFYTIDIETDTTNVSLTGKTYDGISVLGSDTIVLVNRSAKINRIR